MRNARARSLALTLAGAMLWAPAVGAQRAGIWSDSARTLEAAIRVLRDSIVHGDSTAREVARHGDLVISASEGFQNVARQALGTFAALRHRWYGDAMPNAAGFRITVRINPEQLSGRAAANATAGVVILTGLPDHTGAARVEWRRPVRDLTTVLATGFDQLMFASLPPPWARWLDGPVGSLTAGTPRELDDEMYALATGTGGVQRGCAAGVIASCATAMNLDPEPGPAGGHYLPFLRRSLFAEAVRVGGPGAWTRFVASDTSSIAGALGAAAGVSPDALLARWRAVLLARRPPGGVITLANVGIALAWIVVAAAAAFGATRWT